MYGRFLLLILVHWNGIVSETTIRPYSLNRTTPEELRSYFWNDYPPGTTQVSYNVNQNFSYGATLRLPSSYKCNASNCMVQLSLLISYPMLLPIDVWCNEPAFFRNFTLNTTTHAYCISREFIQSSRIFFVSATAQVHKVSTVKLRGAVIYDDTMHMFEIEPINVDIVKPIRRDKKFEIPKGPGTTIIKRSKRQNIDGGANQMQTMSLDNGTHVNQPIQLNTYTGVSNLGHTADLTCNKENSCLGYPKNSEQNQTICCFPLPQLSNGTTALSSVIYQDGANNLKDFQVNVSQGQSFNAANDLSVFMSPIIATSQCHVILPPGTSQFDSARFRITWTYHSNSADDSLSSLSTATVGDGSLPVAVLSVTSDSAFVRQKADYNEWFVCPPAQDGQVSLLRSIALLNGNNIDYFRCIYANNQSIPLKDPTTGQLLVFTSSRNSTLDNSAIISLPTLHTDCLSIQFFSTNGTAIDLKSILLSITVAFQTAAPADMSAMKPHVSDLQGTFQIDIGISIDLSSDDDDSVDNNGQALPSTVDDNLATNAIGQCARYQSTVPMSSYDTTVRKYTGALNMSAQSSQTNILSSVTVTGSSTVENPITMLLVDSQGNRLSPSYNLTSGTPLQLGLAKPISKIILQATAQQDAPMDSTLAIDIATCPSTQTDKQAGSRAVLPGMSQLGSNSKIPSLMEFLLSPEKVSPNTSVGCQDKTSSTYGTYPPDLSTSSVPTKVQPTKMPNTYATPPTPNSSALVQNLPNHTCFDQMSLSNNPFIYDIVISTSDYTNSADCLSSTNPCSITFINTKQPTITLLFAALACPSYLRIPSPSNVQQFSYAMYDEIGVPIPLSGAIDDQGTLLSSSGDNPLVQLNQFACGYSITVELLKTKNNRPPTKVTIEAGGCFRQPSEITANPTLTPVSAVDPSTWSQKIPSSVSISSNGQPTGSLPATQSTPSVNRAAPLPLTSPRSPAVTPALPLYCANDYELGSLLFGDQCIFDILTNDPNIIVDYAINPDNLGIDFQLNVPITIIYRFSCNMYLRYICTAGTQSNVNKFSYMILDIDQNIIGQGVITQLESKQCIPRPLPTVELASQLVITIDETTDGRPPIDIRIDIQGCRSVSPSSSSGSTVDGIQVNPIPGLSPQLPISPSVVTVPTPILPASTVSTPFQIPVQSSPASISNVVSSGTTPPSNMCPQVSLSIHPSVELIVFSDGTNVTSDIDPDGNGCNLVSTGTTVTILLRKGTSATFSSVGVSSPNVNQIDVAIFDESSNRPLIQLAQGKIRSPLTLNPSVQNLPANPAATVMITFLTTVDGQPPRNVRLLVYACFPTVTEVLPSQTFVPSMNKPYFPTNNPTTQTNQLGQAYQYPSTKPMTVCIDSQKPSQVTSIANTQLPQDYYSSNRCVCMCEPGTVLPASSGVIQYNPPTRTMNRNLKQSRRKRENLLTKPI